MKKTYYWTCPTCGASLDPGERCEDCNPRERIPYPDAKGYKSVDHCDRNRKEMKRDVNLHR